MEKRSLSTIIYMGYFLIGIVSFIISPTLPLIIKDFQISIGVAGSIFAASSLGSSVGAILGGFLSDIFGRKPLSITGCILQFTGFFVVALTRNWTMILTFFFIANLGRGFLSICFNALISDINPDRRGAAFNTLHGIYGIGNLIGPIIAGALLSLNFEWRVIYYGAGALWFIFMFINLKMKYPSVEPREAVVGAEGKMTNPFTTLFLNPVLPMLFLVSFIYNGSATGLVGWINTYLGVMNFPVLLGASMVSVFYIGLTIGRFLCRSISDRVGYSKVIFLCALGSFLFYPIAIYSNNAILITIGVFGSGLSLAGLHPTGLAYVNSLFPEMSGTVTALLSTAMSLGSMSIPWIIGVVAEQKSFPLGFSIAYISIAILILVSILLIRHEKKIKA